MHFTKSYLDKVIQRTRELGEMSIYFSEEKDSDDLVDALYGHAELLYGAEDTILIEEVDYDVKESLLNYELQVSWAGE
jgi:hypothetical protein